MINNNNNNNNNNNDDDDDDDDDDDEMITTYVVIHVDTFMEAIHIIALKVMWIALIIWIANNVTRPNISMWWTQTI